MFSKVLIATDLSEASEKVLEYSEGLMYLGCREILLVHVIYVKHTVGLSEVMAEKAAPILDEQKRTLENKGFKVSVETTVGVPGTEITRLTVERGCKMIVIGSHGHSMAREVALGGVATDVVHRSEVPVLVVRLQILEQETGVICKTPFADIRAYVLHPTDFSDNAERAFEYVDKLVRSGCKKVTLMHVQEATRISPHIEQRLEEFNRIDRSRLERMKDKLMMLGEVDVDINIVYGNPIKEIVQFTRDKCPSLVVMGSHGRGFIADIFLGSVSHNIVRHSPVPVLLIPAVR